MKRIFVYGFPGLYGGASTELHHQIIVWRRMEVDVHLIPMWNSAGEPLLGEMLSMGVIVHAVDDFSSIAKEDPIINFCNVEFLKQLPTIRKYTRRTIFVNCMTWLFEEERKAMINGQIAMFLYQNEEVMQKLMGELRIINQDDSVKYLAFKPYFDSGRFNFVSERSSEFFGCGRISRQDPDKFAANTLHVYDYFASPKPKRGLFLGYDHTSENKIGTPFDWIRTARDQHVVSQGEFYEHCEIILQPSDTTENWPRIGFEAMASGSILIVDNRGGWRKMISHGETGWLCNHERDFIYYASKMAYEPSMRAEIAEAARLRGLSLGGMGASIASWRDVFSHVQDLPL